MLYYRLLMVDKDGRFNYSTVVALNTSHKAALVALYPNPAKDKATVSGVEAGMSVRVLDAGGKVLQVQKVTSTTETLLLSGFVKGLYSVQVFGTDGNPINIVHLVKE